MIPDDSDLSIEDREMLIRGGFDLVPAVAVRSIAVADCIVTEWDKGGVSIDLKYPSRRINLGVDGAKQLAEWFKGLGP